MSGPARPFRSGAATASPVVSVVIPVHDGERYLAEAIESILTQTLPPGQVIVVDDGSTDGTRAVARAFGARVSYTRQPRGGVGAAVNEGVGLASGNVLAFLDADDVWLREKLGLQVAALARDPALEAVFGHVEQFHSPDLSPAERAAIHCPPGATPGYVRGALAVRVDAFRRIGPFAGAWKVGEFVDWWARAVDAGVRYAMLPDVVMRRRLHTRNTVTRERSSRVDYPHILKAALDRRRAGA